MPTWHSMPTWHGALPLAGPDPVFPTLANQTFVDVTSVGTQAHNTQWSDAIRGGKHSTTCASPRWQTWPMARWSRS
jgi:hypothetical protein